MRNLRLFVVVIILSLFQFISCTEKTGTTGNNSFDISGILLPSSFTESAGAEIEFRIVGGNGPKMGDIARFVPISDPSLRYDSPITGVNEKQFCLNIPKGITTGQYQLWIVRDKAQKKVGNIQINIKSNVEVEPEGDATVYGVVESDGAPISGVVVSDGYEVTITDDNGIYQMKSAKKHEYVFISLPSGYEAPLKGAIPQIHQALSLPATSPERADFNLKYVGDQTEHTMLFLGDMHLANRNNDRDQFGEFIADVNSFISGKKNIYACTLGDLTWDIYWVSNSYNLNNYLADIKKIPSLPIYNTIGNHDHTIQLEGDFLSASDFKDLIGPTYYSYNIGEIHYIVLDDINADNTGNPSDPDNGRKHYVEILDEQIDWLKKDLEHVSTSTPLIISMHAQLNSIWGTETLKNKDNLLAALSGYKTHFVTGHTHRLYNWDRLDERGYYEHNSGAVCGTWWWSGKLTAGIHIGLDGTPGGYQVFTIKGKDISWQYKATGKDISHQFRTYDRNEIDLSASKYCPHGSEANQTLFNQSIQNFAGKSSENIVYINIWNWDPEWKIEIKEGDKVLSYKKSGSIKDPLHLVAYEAPRYNTTSNQSSLAFKSGYKLEIFEVKASAPNTTLEIKVTDRFGNVYTESMRRPKAFQMSSYK